MPEQPVKKIKLHSWRESLEAILQKKVIMMLFLGFSSGLPLLLIFSSLSLWLREAGIERATVTYFSWAALGYSFKFVWAPLIDRLPLPLITRLMGQRRGWLLVAQLGILLSLVSIAMINPSTGGNVLVFMGFAAVALGFSAATQDIVIDAYRIESAGTDLQALMSASYIAGYRIGMLVSGAGALFLASYFGSTLEDYQFQAWSRTYMLMSLTMLVGIVTTFVIHEPEISREEGLPDFHSRDHLGLVLAFMVGVSAFVACFYFSGDVTGTIKNALIGLVVNEQFSGFLAEMIRLTSSLIVMIGTLLLMGRLPVVNNQLVYVSYISPVRNFFESYGVKTAVLLLCLICLYRISDMVLGIIANIFYQDMGFSKVEIATVVKTFGLFMTIFGGFMGGILVMRYGLMSIMFVGALSTAATNLMFILLSETGYNIFLLYVVISADNLTAGIASAAFVAFLSSLVDIRFTAMQYAIFSSLMFLIPKAIGGYSGTIVDAIGYSWFFAFAAMLGVPVLLLIVMAAKGMRIRVEKASS